MWLAAALHLSTARAEESVARPAAPPAPVEVVVPVSAPFAVLEGLVARAQATPILDLERGELRRGRVELLRAAKLQVGVRIASEPTAAMLRLLRRLEPLAVVVADVPADASSPASVASLAATLAGLSASSHRVVLRVPPSVPLLGALRPLRRGILRLLLASGERGKALRLLDGWLGPIELAVSEGTPAAALAALPWPARARLAVETEGSSYLADGTLAALRAARRGAHVVRTAHPLRAVDAAQLERLPGLRLELVRKGSMEDVFELQAVRALMRGSAPEPTLPSGR